MSKIALSGNASGTGTLTIAAPNTNSDFTLTLPDTTAPILAGSGITLSASAPANTLVTDASGNVLVNGTSTTAKFAVANNTTDGTYNIRQYAVFGTSTTYLDSEAGVLWGAGLGELQIQNGTSTRPAVLSLGGSLATDEGLGVINFFRSGNTDGYRARAQIAGIVTSSGTANQHGGVLAFRTAADGATSPIERARILASGQFNPGADNSYTFGGSGIRWAAIWAANGTIQTSDGRQKNTITSSDLGLEFVSQLRPVSYKWNVGKNNVSTDGDGNTVITPSPGVRTHYGLIAQEVKEVVGDKDFGGFIHDPETDEMGLRYDQFIAPMIKAIQEQQAIINDLKARLDAANL